MIIWIASYPKSGNTWVRALLCSYFYSNSGKFDFHLLDNIEQFPNIKCLSHFVKDFSDPVNVTKYWIPAQSKINLENKIKFFKTHNAMCVINGNQFTNALNTAAVIYVVRDPRNVVTSLASHYEISILEAFKFFTNKRKIIFPNENHIGGDVEKGNVNFIGDWLDHYKSWTNIKFAPVFVVKYEDLIHDANNTFDLILKFLKNIMPVKYDKEKIQVAVKTTNFDVLQKKEEKSGFSEAVFSSKNNRKIKFFNLGNKNSWKDLLDSKIEKKINEAFGLQMKELGYL